MSGSAGQRPQALADPALDAQLAREGYLILPLLDPVEVEALHRAYLDLAPDDDGGMVIDFTRDDRSVVHRVRELLTPVWHDHLEELFVDHRPVISTFVVKHPDPHSAMVLHNEPTFVEAPPPAVYNVWVPLVDTGPDHANGALQLLVGTQDLRYGLTGYNTPLLCLPYERYLRGHARTLDVPAGSAAIYDTRMLHFSDPNRTDEVRPAFAAAMAPRGVPLVHVVATGRRGRRVHRVDEEFFLEAHPASATEATGAYAVLHEEEEGWILEPAEVAAALGRSDVPVAEPLVPHDVRGDVTLEVLRDLEVLAGSPLSRGRPADHDVALGAADVAAGSVLGVRTIAGRAAAVTLPSGAALPDGLRALADPSSSASVLVLDPGARVELSSDVPVEVAVFECPAISAGLLGAAEVAQFELGRAYRPTGSGPFTIWNDGPGPTWLVVSRPPRRWWERFSRGGRSRTA